MNIIDKFLLNYNSKSTISSYRTHLNNYFKAIKAKPDETYFNKSRDYLQDIKKFWQTQVNRPPLTRHASLSCVKIFFLENNIEMPSRFWTQLKNRVKGSKAITKSKIPELHELKRILQYADLKSKTLFLVVFSSGMRIRETLQLHESDINMESNPVQINIRSKTTKTGNSRITFISNEAKESLKEWLRIKKEYIENSSKKCFKACYILDIKNDPRIFPYHYNTAKYMWDNLVRKAGFLERDEETNRRRLHIHCLRKAFRVYLSPKATADVAEVLMGHSDALNNVYRQYTEKQLKNFYLKAMSDISVFETSSDERLNEFHEELAQKDKEIQNLKSQMDKMNQTMLMLLAKKQTEQ